jgi:hypothetical protein
MIKAGFSVGRVSAVDLEGRTIWIVNAHRDEKRFVVCADEKLTAFLELELAIRAVGFSDWLEAEPRHLFDVPILIDSECKKIHTLAACAGVHEDLVPLAEL